MNQCVAECVSGSEVHWDVVLGEDCIISIVRGMCACRDEADNCSGAALKTRLCDKSAHGSGTLPEASDCEQLSVPSTSAGYSAIKVHVTSMEKQHRPVDLDCY